MAVWPLLVQDAHYARPEAFTVFLFTLALYGCWTLRSRGFRPLLFAGACSAFGVLAAVKISLAPLAVLPLLFVWSNRPGAPWIPLRLCVLWACATVAGMFAGVPDAFVHPRAYLSGVVFLQNQYSGVFYPHSVLSGARVGGLLMTYFGQTTGPLLLVACTGALFLRRERRIFELVVLCIPVAVYVVLFSLQRSFFERNLSHVVPLAAVLSGVGMARLVVPIASYVPLSRAREIVAAALITTTLWTPAELSARIALIAMSRASEAESMHWDRALTERTGHEISTSASILSETAAHDFWRMTVDAGGTICVRIIDYNDPFTNRNLALLRQCVDVKELEVHPTLFADVIGSTLHTYHSPTIRYLLLRARTPGASGFKNGIEVVKIDTQTLPASPIREDLNGWVANGVYHEVGVPFSGSVFGSWAHGGDSNSGSFYGVYDVAGRRRIDIPFVTGPNTRQLEVVIQDARSGLQIARFHPPVAVEHWMAWRLTLPRNTRSVSITATDHGIGWGQWMAVGRPRY